jgi:dihydrofolate reductase
MREITEKHMRKLTVFNNVTLDGYFTDKHGDMNWAHKDDPEWNAFTAENAKGGGVLLLGRVTYELMASFWPTPMAMEQMPDVAKGMNNLQKVVFSRTLDKASWNNTKLVKSDLVEEVRKMKTETGQDMVILGSGTIVSQLSEHRLIDEYQIVLVPIILGQGRTMFEGMKDRLMLKRTKARTFENGNVLVSYEPLR